MNVCAICQSEKCPAASDDGAECTGGIGPLPEGEYAIVELCRNPC
jgi:hypothetical protein